MISRFHFSDIHMWYIYIYRPIIIFNFQIDMFDNMSIIVLTQIHIMFVHFFGIGSVSSYFLWLKLLLHLKMRKKKERQTFRPQRNEQTLFLIFLIWKLVRNYVNPPLRRQPIKINQYSTVLPIAWQFPGIREILTDLGNFTGCQEIPGISGILSYNCLIKY